MLFTSWHGVCCIWWSIVDQMILTSPALPFERSCPSHDLSLNVKIQGFSQVVLCRHCQYVRFLEKVADLKGPGHCQPPWCSSWSAPHAEKVPCPLAIIWWLSRWEERCCYTRAVCAHLLSCVRVFVAPQTVAHQAPLPMEFSRLGILEWVAIFSSRGSSQTRDRTHISCVSCIGKRILYH